MKLILLGVAAFAMFMVASMGYAPETSAAQCRDNGRECGYGYFTNRGPTPSGNNMFTPANLGLYANNLNDLYGGLGGKMQCRNAGQPGSTFGVPQNDQNATSAAFIVLTMLGAPPGTAKNQACERWTEWTELVAGYDRAGRIHYNEYHDFDCINTLYTRVNADAVYYAECGAAQSIVFYGANGAPIYAIKRDCANPVGRVQGLPPVVVTPPPSGDINTPTPGDGSTPPGYRAGDSAINSSCQVISGHAFDPKRPSYATRVNVTYSIGGGGQATASTSGSHLFTLDTPAAVRNSYTAVSVTAVGVDSDGRTFAISGSPITIGPCVLPEADCGGFTVTPSSLDSNTPFQVSAAVRYGNATERAAVQSSGARFYMRVVRQGSGAVIYNNTNVTPVTSNGVTLSAISNTIPPTGTTGTFIVSWGMAGGLGTVNCGGDGTVRNDGDVEPPATFAVANKPYFQVNGGDISAGAGMGVGGADCATGGVAQNQKAGIASWNRGPTGNYGGAGTQYAASVLGHLQGFATGQGTGLAPSAFSFANTGGTSDQIDAGRELYGGEFGGIGCTTDYFEKANNVRSGPQLLSQLLNVPAGSTYTVADGSNLTFYVRGNVQVDVNVRFAGSTAGYANAAAIPVFSVISEGNIYISPGITQLDGFYIAQPTNATATNGIIYTCSTANFTPATLTRSLQANCNTALTVNGAFVARQVWLLRTAGTLSTTPAETFNYTPELWANTPFGSSFESEADGYDSITSLPPVL